MTAELLARPRVFERNDRIYLTTPVLLGQPSEGEVEEFAFASAVKSKAPNENIGWLQGKYVEADRGNLNGAMWLSDELALKSLTPILCPVTVMHDPRTAVGCIADAKLFTETASTHIETVLGIWRHRFPDTWDEIEHNIKQGEMAQSMECYAPWYTCSTCERSYVKLPQGAERASWCDHLRSNESRRILRDTCFTGTGLIFGSRGGVPAYTEAQLDHFADEVAEYHEKARTDGKYTPSYRSTSHMGLVQIEESELATLRRERDEARTQADTLQNEKRDLTTQVETAQAAQRTAEAERDQAKTELASVTETAQKAQLKETRMSKLSGGFLDRLGDMSKSVLNELAATASDEDWERAVAEREELAGVKRDAASGDNGNGPTPPAPATPSFDTSEIASFVGRANGNGNGGGTPAPVSGATAVRQLSRAFNKKPAAGAAK